MAEVPDMEQFNQLVRRFDALEEECNFLRSILLGQKYLTRPQAMKALDVSAMTLYRLAKKNAIISWDDSYRTYYDLESVRNYLISKKISKNAAESRVVHALYANEPTQQT